MEDEQRIIPVDSSDSGNSSQSDDVELSGCASTACCNPRSACHRFMALFFMCLLGFGKIYYDFYNPGLTHENLLTTHFLGLHIPVYSVNM